MKYMQIIFFLSFLKIIFNLWRRKETSAFKDWQHRNLPLSVTQVISEIQRQCGLSFKLWFKNSQFWNDWTSLQYIKYETKGHLLDLTVCWSYFHFSNFLIPAFTELIYIPLQWVLQYWQADFKRLWDSQVIQLRDILGQHLTCPSVSDTVLKH